ncbi:unnamed protein product [Vicia faba]|uniref:Uncharacterized protein n=1 Tax=Vicia faba TaxID=3906 RepID=A0AAV0Z4T5_VICFA|nr:unnamed protein product [Vicia faba]
MPLKSTMIRAQSCTFQNHNTAPENHAVLNQREFLLLSLPTPISSGGRWNIVEEVEHCGGMKRSRKKRCANAQIQMIERSVKSKKCGGEEICGEKMQEKTV